VDQLNLERMGFPTVTMSSSEFIGLAKDTAIGQGAADLSFVVVPQPMGMIPVEEIRKKADLVFPEILRMATEWKPEAKLPPMKPVYPAGKLKFKGSVEEFNKLFSEGFILRSPGPSSTPERVAEI
jgi:hypothetical protein